VEVLSVAAEMKAAGTEGLIKTVPRPEEHRRNKVNQGLTGQVLHNCYMLLHGVPQ
jgi:hypothetical protein